MSWSLHSTCKQALLFSFAAAVTSTCKSRGGAYEDMVQGTIAYPFFNNTRPIGKNGSEDKFIIRSTRGGTEYAVEIPAAGADYDVEVPLADLKDASSSGGAAGPGGQQAVSNAQVTDREVVANMPKLSSATEEERALMDKAFGVGELGGPRQSPSYMLGLAKVGDDYRQHKFEFALIEINNLLAFYPTSVRLYKMKGTVLIKLGSLVLAERAWIRAAELAPEDPVVKKGLDRLRRRMALEQKMSTDSGVRVIPEAGPNSDLNKRSMALPVPAVPVPAAAPVPAEPQTQTPQQLNQDLDGTAK